MLKIFNTLSYQEKVDELYAQLIKDMGSMSLDLFEFKCRQIAVLNLKIICKSADYDKKEGMIRCPTI